MVTTVLEIRGDSTSLVRASREADRALDSTSRKAEQLGTKAKVGGNNLSAAFGATGGGLSVGRGLVGISDGFKNANSGMALFAASQALLDLGRLSSDMGAVGAATGATGGAFSKLGAIIKANPVLAIAGLIATAAAAMSLFGDETKDTADQWEKLGKAVKDAQLGDATSKFLSKAGTSEIGALEGLIKGYVGEFGNNGRGKNPTIAELSSQSGYSQAQIREAGNRSSAFFQYANSPGIQESRGGSQILSPQLAAEVLRQLYFDLKAANAASARDPSPGRITPGYASGAFSQEQAQGPGFNFGGRILTSQEVENQRIGAWRTQNQQLTALSPGTGPGSVGQRGTNFAELNNKPAYESFLATQNAATEKAAQEASEHMEQLVRQGEAFGASLTGAFYSALSGAQSLRQSVAQIVSQLARAGLSRALAGIGGAVAGSFAPTGTSVRTPGKGQ